MRHQMLWQQALDGAPARAFEHVRLTEATVPEMPGPIATSEPRPFGPRTVESGGWP
ncbi:hypothetical protein BLAT2472_10917 [Burkholderia latens]